MQKSIEKSFPGARGGEVSNENFMILLLKEKSLFAIPAFCAYLVNGIYSVLAVKVCHPILENSLDLIPQI